MSGNLKRGKHLYVTVSPNTAFSAAVDVALAVALATYGPLPGVHIAATISHSCHVNLLAKIVWKLKCSIAKEVMFVGTNFREHDCNIPISYVKIFISKDPFRSKLVSLITLQNIGQVLSYESSSLKLSLLYYNYFLGRKWLTYIYHRMCWSSQWHRHSGRCWYHIYKCHHCNTWRCWQRTGR